MIVGCRLEFRNFSLERGERRERKERREKREERREKRRAERGEDSRLKGRSSEHLECPYSLKQTCSS